jgi:hypothetical protein
MLLHRFTAFALLLVLLLLPFQARLHPFYVGHTEIVLNPKTRLLEVSIRLFTNDLEKELAKKYKRKIDLSSTEPKTMAAMDSLLIAYQSANFQVFAGKAGKQLSLHFVGRERIEENTYCYWETESKMPEATRPRVICRLLYATHPKQINLVRYKAKAIDKTLQISNPDAELSF